MTSYNPLLHHSPSHSPSAALEGQFKGDSEGYGRLAPSPGNTVNRNLKFYQEGFRRLFRKAAPAASKRRCT